MCQSIVVDCFLLCSPEGRKFRSKTELEAYIRKYSLNVNVSDFCFTVRGQRMLDLAASHDSANGKLYKRKRNLSQEAAIDGRLESTTSSEIGVSLPKRKRMKLWEGPSATKAAVMSVDSGPQVVNTSTKESKKHNKKNNVINSRIQTKETRVHEDRDLLTKHAVKSQNTRSRHALPKLTVQMKFMPLPTSPKKLQPDSVQKQSPSQSQISEGFYSSASNDDTNLLMSNGESSFTLSNVVSKRHGPRNKKQQSGHYTLTSPQISPAKSPALNRKRDSMSPQQNIVTGDDMSTAIQWIPPQSPFNLIEESLFHSSWKILVASIILENGQGTVEFSCLLARCG